MTLLRTITVDGVKKFLFKDGKFATSDACCCGGCSGPCDESTPCPEGCACVDGECVEATGVCCIENACDSSYTTQEACESCETVYECTEYLFLEDPEEECPEGWQGGGGFCSRVTNPESCEGCAGDCFPQQVGPCGDWIEGGDCNISPDCTGVVGYYICGIPNTFPVPVDNTSTRPAPDFRNTGFEYIPDGLYLEYNAATGTFSSGAPYSGVAGNACGRWKISIGPFQQGNLCDVPTMSIEIDLGPVVEGECLPMSGDGILYWTACRDCGTPCGFGLPGPAFISGSTTFSVTLSETPCS